MSTNLWQDQFVELLFNAGSSESAVLTVITGDVCNCVTNGQDGKTPDFQWARDNGETALCNSVGLNNQVITNTNITLVLTPPGISSTSVPKYTELKSVIGEISEKDLFAWGSTNSDDYSYVDLSSYTGANEKHVYLTYESNKYAIRAVLWNPSRIGQSIFLERRTD